jgi:predicted transposase/invertase (TIGR01784 family)
MGLPASFLENTLNNPHDAYFKSLLGRRRLAVQFVRHYLPAEVTAQLDLRTLEQVKDSFVAESLREFFSDLIYRVRRRDGAEVYVYLLLEHKSAPDKWAPLQLLGYEVKFWEQAKEAGAERLPLIIPVVLYHGRQRWNIAQNFQALVEGAEREEWLQFIPRFKYHLCDLSQIADEEITGAAELQAGLLLMKYIFRDELLDEQLEKIASRLQEVPEGQLREHLMPMATYVAATHRDVSPKQLESKLKAAFTRKRGKVMPTLLETWIEKGVQQGLELGVQQGRQEEALKFTLRLLARRFGELSGRLQARLRHLSVVQLEELGLALLEFKTTADLYAWLRAQENGN